MDGSLYPQRSPSAGEERRIPQVFPQDTITVVGEIPFGAPRLRVWKTDDQNPSDLHIQDGWELESRSLPSALVPGPVTTAPGTHATTSMATFWDFDTEKEGHISSETSNTYLTNWGGWSDQGNLVSVSETSLLFPPLSPLTDGIFDVGFLSDPDLDFGGVGDAVRFAPAITTRDGVSQSFGNVEEGNGIDLLGTVSRPNIGGSGDAASSHHSRTFDRAILPMPTSLTFASTPSSSQEYTSSSPASGQNASPRDDKGSSPRGKNR